MSNEAEISEIMAKARKQIEEKKAQLGIKSSNSIDDKKSAILALKAKIAAASSVHLEHVFEPPPIPRILTPLEQEQLRVQTQEERDRSLNLIIDSEGRTIDKRTGEIVQIESRLPTLKANIQAKKRTYDSRTKQKSSDQLASGIASTISGISSVFSSNKYGSVSELPQESANTESSQSENFFDPRLK